MISPGLELAVIDSGNSVDSDVTRFNFDSSIVSGFLRDQKPRLSNCDVSGRARSQSLPLALNLDDSLLKRRNRKRRHDRMILNDVSVVPQLRRKVLCSTTSRECMIQTLRIENYGGLDWPTLDSQATSPSDVDCADVREPLLRQIMRTFTLTLNFKFNFL